jgi:hypothetical protein
VGIAILTVAAPENALCQFLFFLFGRYFTCRVCVHYSFSIGIRKVQPVAEEQRPHERQFFKLLKGYWVFEQLPFRLQREELVDELFGIGQEIVVVVFVPETLRCPTNERRKASLYLKLSDLVLFPAFGASLALTKWRAPQLHWTNLQAPAT